ncbi:MAG: hypothetical protein JSS20_22360, partial [Proteobacteria bacterium]|nr:hypothetical protein [Pseudomonadota bacterium]
PEAFANLLLRLAVAEGDEGEARHSNGAWLVRRPGWRLMRGLGPLSPAIFEAWNGLIEGLLAVHNRFLKMETTERLDWGDPSFTWRIRRVSS